MQDRETRLPPSKFPAIFAESGQAGVARGATRDRADYHLLRFSPMPSDRCCLWSKCQSALGFRYGVEPSRTE